MDLSAQTGTSVTGLADDGRFVERFIIASWAEYVRLRTRMTVSDRALQDRVEALQRADVPRLAAARRGAQARPLIPVRPAGTPRDEARPTIRWPDARYGRLNATTSSATRGVRIELPPTANVTYCLPLYL